METVSYKIEDFEGPLDVLLHLVVKHKMELWDICIYELIDQYLAFVGSVETEKLESASEFLEMAARLVYMKSLALLPRQDEKEELEKELTGQLVEYHLCKQAASRLRDMSEGISFYVREPMELDFDNDYSFSHEARVLLESYLGIMGRGVRLSEPDLGDFEPLVTAPIVSVASRIVSVLRNLRISHVMKIGDFFKNSRSRSEAVATFLGILELIKAKRIEVNDSGDVTAIDRKRDTVV